MDEAGVTDANLRLLTKSEVFYAGVAFWKELRARRKIVVTVYLLLATSTRRLLGTAMKSW